MYFLINKEKPDFVSVLYEAVKLCTHLINKIATKNKNNRQIWLYYNYHDVHVAIDQTEPSRWQPWLSSIVRWCAVEVGAQKSTSDIKACSSNYAKQECLLQSSNSFLKWQKTCSSFAISQHSRVLCYADDARSLCAQIKELINSDPQACHQPIEILSRSWAERPGESARDTKASALKIRHETPAAAAFKCSLTGDPLILIAYPQTTRENRDKMHSFVLKPSLLKCGAATH